MANVILLAGAGLRFSKEGYVTPKPLIPVSEKPMIIQAIKHMPLSNKWIFIARLEHIKEHDIDKIIKREIPEAIIIAVDKTTSGQASTCLLAQAYLEPEEPLLIAACDNSSLYDGDKYQKLIDNTENDCIVWTVTKMKKLKEFPNRYGWAKLAEDNQTIVDMSVKTPISKDPYNDHALVSTFYFKKAKDFIDAANLMIIAGYRINNEFYVDAVPLFLNKLNKKSIIFDVDRWISWGTPEELKEYQHWENFFKENILFNERIHNKEQYIFWKEYFKREKKGKTL